MNQAPGPADNRPGAVSSAPRSRRSPGLLPSSISPRCRIGEPAPDTVTAAKRYILAELEAGREPPAAEVAEAVEMDPKRLGTLLGRAVTHPRFNF